MDRNRRQIYWKATLIDLDNIIFSYQAFGIFEWIWGKKDLRKTHKQYMFRSTKITKIIVDLKVWNNKIK